MLAAAAVTQEIQQVILVGLAEIPENCRLAEDVRLVMKWKEEGLTWEAAVERIHLRYDEAKFYHWCHTNSNAMIVALGLLFAKGHACF